MWTRRVTKVKEFLRFCKLLNVRSLWIALCDLIIGIIIEFCLRMKKNGDFPSRFSAAVCYYLKGESIDTFDFFHLLLILSLTSLYAHNSFCLLCSFLIYVLLVLFFWNSVIEHKLRNGKRKMLLQWNCVSIVTVYVSHAHDNISKALHLRKIRQTATVNEILLPSPSLYSISAASACCSVLLLYFIQLNKFFAHIEWIKKGKKLNWIEFVHSRWFGDHKIKTVKLKIGGSSRKAFKVP